MIDVVIIASGSNGLGAVRSLNEKGLKIAVICDGKHDESMYSRLPRIKRYISRESGDLCREKQLLEILKEFEKFRPVLIPTADWMITTLESNQDYIGSHFQTCLPDKELSEALIDKAQEVQLFGDAISLPKTIIHLPSTPQQLLEQLSLPIIIKPRSHQHYVLKAKNVRLFTPEDVETFYQKFGEVLEHLIAQELIPGPDSRQWVCNCFFDANSDLYDAFTFNRLSLAPAHFGVTSYAISEYNEEVIALSAKLGKQIKYVGPAMIEFKQDERDGTYKYIELNPRIGMCNYFDTQCGVNNVYYTYQLARGQLPTEHNRSMRSGIIYIDLWEDFYSRKKDGSSYTNILKNYVADATKVHVFSHFLWNDPLPVIKRWIAIFKSFLKNSLL